MLDPKRLRSDIDEIAAQLQKRGFRLDVQQLTDLEAARKRLQVKTQDLQNQRNQFSKDIGQAKAKGIDVADLMTQSEQLGHKLGSAQEQLEKIQQELHTIQLAIPNLLHESVPLGHCEEDNPVIRTWGEPKTFNFTPKQHTELGADLGLMDFATAVKITGSRFVVLRGALAKLQRALIQFMLDVHTTAHGYQDIYVPYIVNATSLLGTGQLPKFADDQFKLQLEQDYYLIPTAEVPVTNSVRDSILEAESLPLKYACHTPCFRSEAGSYGQDTHGMIRQHQFEKVELVWIVKPDESYAALEQLTQHAQNILEQLQLAYRVITLCAGDIGFSAAKTYDLEVWLPGQQKYREISSCSNCEDFQARRLKARWRNPATGKPELVHTLNGSGLAVGRALIAIMENYQDEQGRIHIPDCLQSYMGGLKIIE